MLAIGREVAFLQAALLHTDHPSHKAACSRMTPSPSARCCGTRDEVAGAEGGRLSWGVGRARCNGPILTLVTRNISGTHRHRNQRGSGRARGAADELSLRTARPQPQGPSECSHQG